MPAYYCLQLTYVTALAKYFCLTSSYYWIELYQKMDCWSCICFHVVVDDGFIFVFQDFFLCFLSFRENNCNGNQIMKYWKPKFVLRGLNAVLPWDIVVNEWSELTCLPFLFCFPSTVLWKRTKILIRTASQDCIKRKRDWTAISIPWAITMRKYSSWFWCEYMQRSEYNS